MYTKTEQELELDHQEYLKSVIDNLEADYSKNNSIPEIKPIPLIPQRLGWKCPICGAVYSPDILSCYKCTSPKIIPSPFPYEPSYHTYPTFPTKPFWCEPSITVTCSLKNDPPEPGNSL